MLNSKNEISLIIPKLEGFISAQQIQNLTKGIKARIASSDPQTNSLVKSLSAIRTVQYKELPNDMIVAATGDNSRFFIGIIQKDSQGPLKSFIGIGTDYAPLINLLSPIIETTFGSGSPNTPVTPSTTVASPKSMLKPTPRPTIQHPPKPSIQPPSQEVPRPKPSTISRATPSTTQLDPNDQVGNLINTAFNAVLQQLDKFTGSDFGKALQEVTDLILENKGYSVTLHNVRTWVNNYKNSRDLLTDQDKSEISEAIETWKKKLL